MNSTANSSPMPATSRSEDVVRSSTARNTLPRWLCSRIPIPEPSRSHSAACARRSTGSGSAAGPDEKLNFRLTDYPGGDRREIDRSASFRARRRVFPVEHGDRNAVECLVRRLRDDDVRDLELRIASHPRGYLLTELIAVRDHRRREHLHTVELHIAPQRDLPRCIGSVSYTHLRVHETPEHL